MDRASDFGSEGLGFESLRARQAERQGRERSVRARVIAVAALFALAACGPSEKTKPPAPEARPAQKGEASALAAGEVRVEVRDGRVTIVCHDAPRGLVVEKLAREGSFQLAGDLDSTPTTLDLEGVPMDQVLPALLAGASYRAQWRFDKDQNRHLLAKLELGEVPGATQAGHKPKIGEALRERIRAMRDKQPSEKQKAEAAADIEPEGPALGSLMETLASDADPRVRAKVAEQLADADGCVASMGLVAATADPDPQVRCKAWQSLEMNCDESMLPSMQPKCANE